MEKIFDKERKGTGTEEWCDYTHNIAQGCIHNCVYCYAKADALFKYKSIKDESEWTNTSLNVKKMNKKWEKLEGVIMFPTVHDITPDNVKQCIRALINMLSVGNQVLIVSKPCQYTINYMIKELSEYKDQILFRFTIGTTDNKILKLVEPGAPTYDERLAALKLAYNAGFRTSISVEPLLGGIKELELLYQEIVPFVTDSIWVGKMNKIDQRVKINSKELKDFIEYLKSEQTDDKVEEIYKKFNGSAYILWKDSVKEVMNKK